MPNKFRSPPRPKRTAYERVMERVVKTDSCWIWQGSCSNGYGKIKVAGYNLGTHRVVCEHHHGPLGLLLATHSCDNRRCVNPEHIQPGTHSTNASDMWKRGGRASL